MKYDRKLLKVWKGAWEQTDGMNPMSFAIDRELDKSGFSIADVMNRLGLIGMKPEKDRDEDEIALMSFFMRANAVAEMALVDKCASGGTQGAMFLLKTKYKYREGVDIGIKDKDTVKKVVKWGGPVAVEGESDG